MKGALVLAFTACLILPFSALAEMNAKPAVATSSEARDETQWIGPMSPEDALEYMKSTRDLVIIDVREPQYINQSFEGGMEIPWTKMEERCTEIPAGRHILLHCGLGMVAPKAYMILKEKRGDLKSVAYIAGAPLFKEYNDWIRRK